MSWTEEMRRLPNMYKGKSLKPPENRTKCKPVNGGGSDVLDSGAPVESRIGGSGACGG